MSRGTIKSRWVETEIEQGGSVFLLPLRCRLEARGERLRTVVQTYCLDTATWTARQKGAWFTSKNASRLLEHQIDEAACDVADRLCAGIEGGPLHSDWMVTESGYPLGTNNGAHLVSKGSTDSMTGCAQ